MSGLVVWAMVGILLLAIALFFWKNTYVNNGGWKEKWEKEPLFIWQLIILGIILLSPGFNLIFFIVGIVVYFGNWVSDDWRFKKIKFSQYCTFLNKRIF